jgi:hypothetical protein
MITANRRASATIAFFIPRRLAICIAQALSQDHFFARSAAPHQVKRRANKRHCAAFDHPHRRNCHAIFDRSRLSPIPPEYPDNSKHAGRNQNENQRRIFDPSNRRDAERHDQPEKTDLPGKDMNAGGKGAPASAR